MATANVPTVTLAQTGKVVDVPHTEGMTIRAALSTAGFRIDRKTQVRLNNVKTTDMDTVLAAGDAIMVIGEVAGAYSA
jgi:molybdopterin converting factor small subunit